MPGPGSRHCPSSRARIVLVVGLISSLFFWVPSAALAQTWPSNPITLILGFPAGSGVDVVARQLQPALEQSLGGKIIFDYKPGAGGNVESDFTPIAPMVDVSNVLTINPEVINVNSVKEFIDLVTANPGKYNFASTGNGTGTHLAFAEFNAKAGLNMVHIPYKANKVRLLGVTTARRVSAVAEVPTISESALPGFENYTWFGLFGPKAMEPTITERINAAIRLALESPAIRQRLLDAGNTPRYETIEQFQATVKANRAKWAEVVKASGATVD